MKTSQLVLVVVAAVTITVGMDRSAHARDVEFCNVGQLCPVNQPAAEPDFRRIFAEPRGADGWYDWILLICRQDYPATAWDYPEPARISPVPTMRWILSTEISFVNALLFVCQWGLFVLSAVVLAIHCQKRRQNQ